jgi:heat-inducible transcriptional repressor
MEKRRTSALPPLADRDREVLREVVLAYVSTGEPVSSRTISRRHGFDLSPATIRNIMADLEDWGYLAQPHTSAGRIPTDLGYRKFVDSLMSPKRPTNHEQERVHTDLEVVLPDSEPILRTAGRLLSELTDQVAVVLSPTAAGSTVRSIHFVRIAEKRFLAVIVTGANLVDQRLVVHGEDFSQHDLDRFSRMLSGELAGLGLHEMRERVFSAMVEAKRSWEAELARMLPLADRALEQEVAGAGSEMVVEGTTRMMSKPEFADVEKMRRIFRIFEEKARIASLLSSCVDSSRARVVIGHEDPFTGDMDLAVVATGYGLSGGPMGTLGIVGPRRMDYSKLVPLVELIARSLGNRMAEETADGGGGNRKGGSSGT